MEVTRKNFKKVLDNVQTSIKNSDFLAINAKVTGQSVNWKQSSFDLPKEIYFKLLKGSTDFLLIQFGLCAFHWDEIARTYKNDAYTFYLYPRHPEKTKKFQSDGVNLKFLVENRLDLNKLVAEGIGYMIEIEEKNLEMKIHKKINNSNQKARIPVPENEEAIIDDVCNKIRNFLDENESETIELDKYNLFRERLILQEIDILFKDEVFVEVIMAENKTRVLKVSRISSENDREIKKKQQAQKAWDELDAALGFSKVARMIRDSGKLVVGHDMLLDIFHSMNSFFERLPDNYFFFKAIAHNAFPRLIDTKYVSCLPPLKDKVDSNSLPLLLSSLSEAPFSMPKVAADTGRGYTGEENAEHVAGYDAYVTGMCFLGMHKYLARVNGDVRVDSSSTVLEPFLDKLYLSRTADQGSPCMNLAGDESLPSRDHVLFVRFPHQWQIEEINGAFSKYGDITLEFLCNNCAVIAFQTKELAGTVRRDFARNTSVTVKSYNEFYKK